MLSLRHNPVAIDDSRHPLHSIHIIFVVESDDDQ